jgi:MFS family permease
VASTLFLAVGIAAFVLQRDTEPKLRDVGTQSHGSAIALRPVQIVTAALVFVGAIFATAEVSTVALTRELGQPDAASLVIGVYATGSFVVGLIVGALNLKAPLQRQLLAALSILLLTTLPLLLVGNVPALAGAIFLSGVAISPTFITAFGLIERRVPAAVLTEGVTWVMTGIGIGMALGAFLSGWVVDTLGPRSGFWVSVGAASLALLTIAAGQRVLGERPVDRPEAEPAAAG